MNYVRPALLRHLDGFWPQRKKEEFVWTVKPDRPALPDLRILRIEPQVAREPWVYVTIGAWEARGIVNHGFEFMLLSRVEDPIHIETLAWVANYHADPAFGVGIAEVLDLGRPWMDGSACDHLLVSLPYPYGPQFEHCVVGAYHVRFLWLLPITASEAAFAETHGVEAFEQQLEARGVDAVDRSRAAVV